MDKRDLGGVPLERSWLNAVAQMPSNNGTVTIKRFLVTFKSTSVASKLLRDVLNWVERSSKTQGHERVGGPDAHQRGKTVSSCSRLVV